MICCSGRVLVGRLLVGVGDDQGRIATSKIEDGWNKVDLTTFRIRTTYHNRKISIAMFNLTLYSINSGHTCCPHQNRQTNPPTYLKQESSQDPLCKPVRRESREKREHGKER